ncbi:hypothetical protein M9Y10_043723 [Tritrichomonas musculus]|uniref:Peptidase S1 domain-containing protein n=1 Tax=Tritrichomonas musculus TaxID=1915356 RepID=A0ABR2K0X4_9EUKA
MLALSPLLFFILFHAKNYINQNGDFAAEQLNQNGDSTAEQLNQNGDSSAEQSSQDKNAQLNIILEMLVNLTNKVDSLNTTIDSLNTSINTKIDSLNTTIDSLNTTIDSLKTKIDSLNQTLQTISEQQNHKKAFILARNSSCKIITIDSEGRLIFGCGNLITINDKFYVSTCLHVVYDKQNQKTYKLHRIEFTDMKLLNFVNNILIFSNSIDLALIEVSPDMIHQKYAIKPLNQDFSYGQSLIGISYRQKYTSMLSCRIVEKQNYMTKMESEESLELITNCGGSNGYSGTGFLNDDGFLIAIHTGSGDFIENIQINPSSESSDFEYEMEDGTEKSNITDTIHNFITNLTDYTLNIMKTQQRNQTLSVHEFVDQNSIRYKNFASVTNQLYQEIRKESQIISRNPRAEALSAKAIYNLIYNTTNKSLRVSFGQYISLSSSNQLPA